MDKEYGYLQKLTFINTYLYKTTGNIFLSYVHSMPFVLKVKYLDSDKINNWREPFKWHFNANYGFILCQTSNDPFNTSHMNWETYSLHMCTHGKI